MEIWTKCLFSESGKRFRLYGLFFSPSFGLALGCFCKLKLFTYYHHRLSFSGVISCNFVIYSDVDSVAESFTKVLLLAMSSIYTFLALGNIHRLGTFSWRTVHVPLFFSKPSSSLPLSLNYLWPPGGHLLMFVLFSWTAAVCIADLSVKGRERGRVSDGRKDGVKERERERVT